MTKDTHVDRNPNTSQHTVTISVPIRLSDSNFDAMLEKHPFLVVEFWARKGPCRMFEPIMDQLATELAGKAAFGRLDIEKNPTTARYFGINNTPTILIFRNGKVVDGFNALTLKAHIQLKIEARCSH